MSHSTQRKQFQPRPNATRSEEMQKYDLPTEALPIAPPMWLPLRVPSVDNQSSMQQFMSTRVEPPAAPDVVHLRSQLRGKKRRVLFVSLAVLLIVSLAVMGIFWLNAHASADVSLFQVRMAHVDQMIGGGGIVYPRQQLNLSYPVAERVVDVLVQAGDQVTPGQSLIRLDPAQLNAQVKQAADNMAAAQAYLDTVSVNGSQVAIAQAQQQYMQAKNKYNALVAQASNPILHNGNLISPIHGVVTSVRINPGEVFDANSILLVIMDESTLIVHMKVPLSNLGLVHVGQAAVITPSALSNRNFQGTVSSVIPQADPQTDTFEVWVNVRDSQHVLLPGMGAFVRIQAASTALIVPRLSLLSVEHTSAVFVIRAQRAYLRPVKTLGRIDGQVLVASGLIQGEYVVYVGLYQLQDGQQVHVRSILSGGSGL